MTIFKKKKNEPDDSLKKLLEMLVNEKEKKSEVQNLGKIAKDFAIEKLDGRSLNAHQWIQ